MYTSANKVYTEPKVNNGLLTELITKSLALTRCSTVPVAKMAAECKQVLVQFFDWLFLQHIVDPIALIQSSYFDLRNIHCVHYSNKQGVHSVIT